jgi:thymidylate synthase (FAD)
METKVELISHTAKPLETLYKIWMENRDPNVHIDMNKELNTAEVERIFKALIASDISVVQNIHFTFKITNMSIALREQLVRHRIGVNLDGRVGADYIPDLTDDGIWIQSMRVLDMGKFYDNNAYELPDSILKNEQAVALYKECLRFAQKTYATLCDHGVPREDARLVVPLACQHDMFWTLNLGALCHILRKRGCWIPQYGLWRPIIVGIVDELATKIHPVFRTLTQPPCVNNGKFNKCHFPEDIARRLDHSDPLPPCPLACHVDELISWSNNVGTVNVVTDADKALFTDMQNNFSKMWGYACIEDLEKSNENKIN